MCESGAEERRRGQQLQTRGTGRNSCSPEIRVDILVVGSKGYLVVPSFCLQLLWLLSCDQALVLSKCCRCRLTDAYGKQSQRYPCSAISVCVGLDALPEMLQTCAARGKESTSWKQRWIMWMVRVRRGIQVIVGNDVIAIVDSTVVG